MVSLEIAWHPLGRELIGLEQRDETAVYRLFDDDWNLLYVGMSRSVCTRIRRHELTQPWGDQIAYAFADMYETRWVASQEERRAIREERPIYNVIHQHPLVRTPFGAGIGL